VRENNEDNLLVAAPLYAVADGMGGHAAGEVASEIAIQVLANAQLTEANPDDLREAVIEANHMVLEGPHRGLGRPGMGTTLTAVLIEENRLIVAQVGDSRAYLLHAGHLRQVTRDHSLMAELIARGEITPDEVRTHPQRSVITRVLGSEPGTLPDLYELDVVTGDRLLLCTDGLTGMIDDREVARLLSSTKEPQKAADALVAAARQAGGYDNITVIVLDIDATDLRKQKQNRSRAKRAVIAFLLVFALAVAGVATGFAVLAYNSFFVVDEGGIVVSYRGFPGEFAGFQIRWELELPTGTPMLPTSWVKNPSVRSQLEADGIRLDSPEQVEAWFAEQSSQFAEQSAQGEQGAQFVEQSSQFVEQGAQGGQTR
jgi:protein phosphatase